MTQQSSISEAMKVLEELLTELDDAYWESATFEHKDFFHDVLGATHGELSELSKLSVQDHHLIYEPITAEFRIARVKLGRLRKLLDDYVPRSRTAARLEVLIGETVLLSSHSSR